MGPRGVWGPGVWRGLGLWSLGAAVSSATPAAGGCGPASEGERQGSTAQGSKRATAQTKQCSMPCQAHFLLLIARRPGAGDRSGAIADGRYPPPARGDAPASHPARLLAGEPRPCCHLPGALLFVPQRRFCVGWGRKGGEKRTDWNEPGRRGVVLLHVLSAPGPRRVDPVSPKVPAQVAVHVQLLAAESRHPDLIVAAPGRKLCRRSMNT